MEKYVDDFERIKSEEKTTAQAQAQSDSCTSIIIFGEFEHWILQFVLKSSQKWLEKKKLNDVVKTVNRNWEEIKR